MVNDNQFENPDKITVENLNFYYGNSQALFDLNFNIPARKVTAIIGPSGCGKSTFLRTLNRMNDIIEGTRVEGQILIDGHDIYGNGISNGRTEAVDQCLSESIGAALLENNSI